MLLSKLILTAEALYLNWPWATLSKRAHERFNDLAVVLFQHNSGTRTVSQSCTNARVLGLFGAKSTIERVKLFSAYIHGDSLALPFVDYFLNLDSNNTPLQMTRHVLYTTPEKSGNRNQKRDSFCRYRGTDYVHWQKKHWQANNCWHHTRACKYNVLSVLGTNFECEGVKCTYFNFTQWWPWKRS